jgi:ribose 5-phosphate isomerase B
VIVFASDHAAVKLKDHLCRMAENKGLQVADLGTRDSEPVDYPDIAHRLAAAINEGEATMGVLLCGTGIGMSMSANRHPGVRAALCHDAYTATMARRHNDANVLCIGARVVGVGVAEQMMEIFLETDFEGGRHQRRVAKIERDAEEA